MNYSGLIAGILALTVAASGLPAAETPPSSSAEISKLKAAAENGDSRAALSLGMRYRDGNGVARDDAEALKWYRQCADQGDADGLDNVGYMYLQGRGVPENFDIAAGFFKAAAKQNHPQALFNLGNCYFSGQGVEQDYAGAIANWEKAAERGHDNATWRLAMLHATGEGISQDRRKAEALCQKLADKGHVNSMLLLGELLAIRGETDQAVEWWKKAVSRGSRQGGDLLKLAEWRFEKPVAGKSAYVQVDHLYQGWNNCGATSVAMFARHAGNGETPYDIKRLCPSNPIGTGTDWADLVAAGESMGLSCEMVTFTNDDAGFAEGMESIRGHLEAGHPVVIDFTVIRMVDGKERRNGHTLLVVGYHAERDQVVLKNPNQPSPGIELMTAEELKSNWYSRGYSRFAKGVTARPLIVAKPEE